MNREKVARGIWIFGLVVTGSFACLLLTFCAYVNGVWPHELSVDVNGPEGFRLTRVDGDPVDEPLPARVAKSLGFSTDGLLVECPVEVSDGTTRARARLRALNVGSLKTGHRAIPRRAASLDGSLWLLDGWAVTVHPAVPGHVWLGYEPWGPTRVSVDGDELVEAGPHACSIPADGTWHEVHGPGFGLRFLADEGVAIHVTEWNRKNETILDLVDSGFASAELRFGGEVAEGFDLSAPFVTELPELELRLRSDDGRRAHVHLKRSGDLRFTLRLSL